MNCMSRDNKYTIWMEWRSSFGEKQYKVLNEGRDKSVEDWLAG